MLRWVIILFSIIFLFETEALSACTTPTGVAGQFQMNGGLFQWCEGTSWVDPPNTQGLGCVASELGKIRYNSGAMEYCDSSFWRSIQGIQTEACLLTQEGMIRWRANFKMLQYCDGLFWYATYNSTAPVINSFNINAGATLTSNNSISTDLSASVSDGISKITHICYKYSTDSSVPTAPAVNDSCWYEINNPSPGVTPSDNISFTNYFYLLGFTPGLYRVYTWVKTSVNLISTLSNAGSGTEGIDKKTIEYDPNPPPEVINVLSANSDSSTFPLSSSDTTVPAGNTVYIKWKASSVTGVGAGPISLYYTEDETTYTLIADGLGNLAGSGCSVDGTTHTGCYTWTNGSPSSAYYRIRVVVEDTQGIQSFNSGPPMNAGAFRVIAGNTETGLNGSAASALIFNNTGPSRIDIEGKSFVVTDDGTFYIRDLKRGILKMDPNTGLLTNYLPYTGTATDGPIGSASLKGQASRLTLDYDGNIIVYDYDRIRKIDLSTETISTIVGGGATIASGTNALDFQFGTCNNSRGYSCPLVVLPNQDMYFLRRNSHSSTPGAGESIWHYQASDQKVYAITPSGTGTQQNATRDISSSKLAGFMFEFDPTNSSIPKFFGLFQRQPCSGCGPHQESAELDQTTWASLGSGAPHPSSYLAQVTALSGELYAVSNRTYLHRYDSATNSWIRILGTGNLGNCPDGTLATNCDTYLRDAFVNAQGTVFFMDNGQMRAIDEAGEVVTLFGQKFSFGDGELATSARFGGIFSIDETSSGKIAVLDYLENSLREFTVGGTIEKLIGNSKPSGSTSGSLGSTQPIGGYCSFSKCYFHYDDTTEDIYYVTDSKVFRYDRASGNVYEAFGNGANDFAVADGMVGSDIQIGSYSEKLYGYNGTKFLAGSNWWNGSYHERAYLKIYDRTDSFRQSQLAGVSGATGGYPLDGDVLATSSIPRPQNNFGKAQWDATNNSWYFAQSNLIRSYPEGGLAGTLATLPRTINGGWTLLRNASSDLIVYYCSSSRVYKYNVTTSTETALPWPSNTLRCGGGTMVYSSTRNSIVFPFVQNDLWGVAEIPDTP